MDAEIRFFMTPKDESEFLEFASKHIDKIKQGSPEQENSPEQEKATKQLFIVGDCELFYTPTVVEGNTMYSGVLEIRIEHDSDTACKSQLRANTAYKKLRNWLKKKYWSRLAYINKTKNDKLMPTRIHWLAPEAKKWKEQYPEKHILKLSKTSWMVFDIGF